MASFKTSKLSSFILGAWGFLVVLYLGFLFFRFWLANQALYLVYKKTIINCKLLHCSISVLVTLFFFLFEQFMIDCSQSVFKLETACGLLSGKGSETIVIRFAPTNPINYYRRLTCLVQNQVTLSTECSLMFLIEILITYQGNRHRENG